MKRWFRQEMNRSGIPWQRIRERGSLPSEIIQAALQFPCVVQSYKDITSPWGNVELVNTVEAFEEYMAYAQADYAYVGSRIYRGRELGVELWALVLDDWAGNPDRSGV